MNNPLARKLIQMNQEKVALKTAHKRGLGTVKFYTYTRPVIDYSDDKEFLRLTATVSSSSSPFPILDVSTDDWNNSVRREVNISSDGRTYQFRYNILDSGVNFKIISTSKLDSVELEWLI